MKLRTEIYKLFELNLNKHLSLFIVDEEESYDDDENDGYKIIKLWEDTYLIGITEDDIRIIDKIKNGNDYLKLNNLANILVEKQYKNNGQGSESYDYFFDKHRTLGRLYKKYERNME